MSWYHIDSLHVLYIKDVFLFIHIYFSFCPIVKDYSHYSVVNIRKWLEDKACLFYILLLFAIAKHSWFVLLINMGFTCEKLNLLKLMLNFGGCTIWRQGVQFDQYISSAANLCGTSLSGSARLSDLGSRVLGSRHTPVMSCTWHLWFICHVFEAVWLTNQWHRLSDWAKVFQQ